MKLTLIKNLHRNEVLAKTIFLNDGTILLNKGTTLTSQYLSKLKHYGIFMVYIEDDDLYDIKEDKYLVDLKQTTLENIPNIFNNIINGSSLELNDSLNAIESLIDYITEQGAVNTNIYEVKAYDNYTYIHCVDTSILAIFLGTALGYNKSDLHNLALSALFHDIGKTKIPNSIINKKGKLTKQEFEIIKLHPFYGKEILSKSYDFCDSVIRGVAEHHEKYDGTGYPFSLNKNELSEFSKIITICDVFTAVSANRSYRDRFDPNEAYELILSNSNIMFDPNIVQKFRDTFSIYPLGCCLRLTNGVEGFVIKQNKYFPDRPVLRILYDENKHKIIPYEIDLLTQPSLGIKNIVL